MIGIFLICGTPPSPLFISEFLLVRGAGIWLGGAILLLLFVIFCGMSANVLKMCMGDNDNEPEFQAGNEAAEKLSLIPAFVVGLLLVSGCVLLYMLCQMLEFTVGC